MKRNASIRSERSLGPATNRGRGSEYGPHTHTFICMCMNTYMYTYVHMCVHINMYTYTYICVCRYTYTCVHFISWLIDRAAPAPVCQPGSNFKAVSGKPDHPRLSMSEPY